MHIRENTRKLVAAAFIHSKEQEDETMPPDVSIEFRPRCDCPSCMSNYLLMFLVMCLEMAGSNEIDFEEALYKAKQTIERPRYLS